MHLTPPNVLLTSRPELRILLFRLASIIRFETITPLGTPKKQNKGIEREKGLAKKRAKGHNNKRVYNINSSLAN